MCDRTCVGLHTGPVLSRDGSHGELSHATSCSLDSAGSKLYLILFKDMYTGDELIKRGSKPVDVVRFLGGEREGSSSRWVSRSAPVHYFAVFLCIRYLTRNF